MSDTTQGADVDVKFNEAREAASLIPVGGAGVQILNFAQQVDMAKWIAKGGYAIPVHLRDNVGACLAVLDISQRWGFSVYQVARLCYVVNDQLAFMAQLVVAVINKFAPLEGRLRYEYEGDGDNRICIVRGTPKGETEPLEYRTPPVSKITPKNSPLWKSDVDQQLGYLAGTRFCRRYFPEILIGIYSPDELLDAGLTPHLGAENAKDVTPAGGTLADRLKAKGDHPAEGYRDGVVEAGLNGDLDHAATATEAVADAPADPPPADPAPKGRKRSTAAATKAAAPAEDKNRADPPHIREHPLPMPENQAQYEIWLKDWLKDFDDEEGIADRWSAEKKLRNACGITADERKPLEELKAARIAELKQEG